MHRESAGGHEIREAGGGGVMHELKREIRVERQQDKIYPSDDPQNYIKPFEMTEKDPPCGARPRALQIAKHLFHLTFSFCMILKNILLQISFLVNESGHNSLIIKT
jgi:hypothetical protein